MQNFKYFLIPFLLGALFWFGVFFFLPKTPVFYVTVNKDFEFFKIDLSKLFFKKQKIEKHIVQKPTYSLKNIKLKAIYNNGKNGFIIIEDKNKTFFVDLNKEYNGYKLIKINNKSAIFTKNGKNYKIEFDETDLKGSLYKETPQSSQQPIKIKKKVFTEYKKNLFKIWQNIGIVKTKEGYKIVFVKPGSIFQKIGLKKGDILIEVNGKKLKNDQDAWALYKNAEKFNEFEIKLKRNNQTKVLYYEVD